MRILNYPNAGTIYIDGISHIIFNILHKYTIMKRKNLLITLSLTGLIILVSCSDNDNPIEQKPINNNTILILNEGNFNQNNSTLAKYDIETGSIIKDFFREVNMRGLGDVGNDMIKYGSKL